MVNLLPEKVSGRPAIGHGLGSGPRETSAAEAPRRRADGDATRSKPRRVGGEGARTGVDRADVLRANETVGRPSPDPHDQIEEDEDGAAHDRIDIRSRVTTLPEVSFEPTLSGRGRGLELTRGMHTRGGGFLPGSFR